VGSESGSVDEPHIIAKDLWTNPLRKYIEGVPILVSKQQVKTNLCDPECPNMQINHSIHFLCSALPHGSSFTLRILSQLISHPVGKLILEFSSLGELLVMYLDQVVSE